VTLTGEYEPSAWDWVREHVETYEGSGGTERRFEPETGRPFIVITTRGAKSGKIRKGGLMRVELGGEYALVASVGGAPSNPGWYHNLLADPTALVIQDGPERAEFVARVVEGDEYSQWWARAVAAYPPYAEYQVKTTRRIPVLVASPKV
jgi:deazaflavin-dependent oxidoreductase (nitroreductase family)